MGERGIPREVRAFITEHLSSLAQLEILLLLHGAPDERFSADAVGESLRIEPGWAASELRGLADRGLLDIEAGESPTFRFAPASDQLRDTVDGLAKSFSTHRVSVITLIFSTPSESIGSFADAFKIRRPSDG